MTEYFSFIIGNAAMSLVPLTSRV